MTTDDAEIPVDSNTVDSNAADSNTVDSKSHSS